MMNYPILLITFLLAFIITVPLGGLHYISICCCKWPLTNDRATHHRALVISDAHLLGQRKRSLIDIVWTDFWLQKQFSFINSIFQPDLVLNIGDVLDEGKRANKNQYNSYIARTKAIFFRKSKTNSMKNVQSNIPIHIKSSASSLLSTPTLPHYTVVGNHDIGWRYLNDLRLSTFERDHNSPNGFFQIGNLTFARINSMALHPDAIKTPGGRNQRDEIDAMLATGKHVDVLMTHQPLYRKNDLHCGIERMQDPKKGGVTFYSRQQQLIVDDDVVNQAYTQRILDQWTPTNILSGHLHSVCRFKHNSKSNELTIPTFSWRMRPDPKYFLVTFQTDGNMQAKQCSLPHEHYFMALIAIWIVVIVLLVVKMVCCANAIKQVTVDPIKNL